MLLALPATLALLAAVPKGPIAIVEPDSPSTMIGLSGQVSREVLAGAEAQKLKVITPEQLRSRLGNKKYDELVKCADRAGCASSLLSENVPEAKAVVTGRLDRDEKNYLVKLWLIDLEKLEVAADVDRAILIASRRLQKDVEQAVPGLLKGEREARGKLEVSCNVANAKLTLNGEFLGTCPSSQELKPGKYELKVEKNRYLPMTRLVDVEPNQKTAVELKLLLKPGERPEEEDVPPIAKNAVAQNPAGSGGVGALTLIAGGATLVTAGVGVGFGIATNAGNDSLQKSFDPVAMTYGATRKNALDVQRNATIANICFVAAGAAAIATVVLLVFDLTRPNAPVVAPVATPNGAGVTLSGSF